MKIVAVIMIFFSWVYFTPLLSARAIEPAAVEHVIVCPSQEGNIRPPDFQSSACKPSILEKVDPQGKDIWISAFVNVPKVTLAQNEPLAITITGSAASALYLNGQLIGRNGRPGDSKETEVAGRMDAAIYLPPGHLRSGSNHIVAHLSSHHGYLALEGPMHQIAIGAYADPNEKILRQYWPALATLGLFLVSWLYFTAMAAKSEEKREALLLSFMSLLAAGQLVAEVARGVSGYLYPYHELRLILIAGFSLGFGLCLAAFILLKFAMSRRVLTLSILAVLTISGMLIVDGFDAKSATGLFIPTIAAAIGTAVWTVQKKPHAAYYFIALLAFALIIAFDPSLFLNGMFFYAVAGLLLFLFYEQARTLIQERDRFKIEEERSKRLELALEQVERETRSQNLKINQSGKVEIISTENISHCSGAGDYVEICLKDGNTRLYGGSLAELEATLPPEFLRVHRSYIINTSLIKSLKREPSGVGLLELVGSQFIPVSRRTMPKVRSALE